MLDAETKERIRKLRAFADAIEPRISMVGVCLGRTVRDAQDASELLFDRFGGRPEVVTRTDIENAYRSNLSTTGRLPGGYYGEKPMHTINGHTVEFMAHGQIYVDGRIIALGVRMANGGHYTYKREDRDDASAALAGRKLTGPRRPVGSYEAQLAADIVFAMFSANE